MSKEKNKVKNTFKQDNKVKRFVLVRLFRELKIFVKKRNLRTFYWQKQLASRHYTTDFKIFVKYSLLKNCPILV